MQSDAVSWAMAILLSMLVHGMLFVHSGARIGAVHVPASEALHVTRLNFSQAVQKPVPDEPRPIQKPVTEPVKKPVTKPVKKIKPRPESVRVAKKILPPIPVEKTEPVRQATSSPQVHGRQVSQATDGQLQAKRQRYLHELLGHIESFRFYPRAARRRLIEGNVRISFILRDDGSYEQLELESGETMLVKAARQALESAAPLPAPPNDIGLSDRIEYTMVYSLAR